MNLSLPRLLPFYSLLIITTMLINGSPHEASGQDTHQDDLPLLAQLVDHTLYTYWCTRTKDCDTICLEVDLLSNKRIERRFKGFEPGRCAIQNREYQLPLRGKVNEAHCWLVSSKGAVCCDQVPVFAIWKVPLAHFDYVFRTGQPHSEPPIAPGSWRTASPLMGAIASGEAFDSGSGYGIVASICNPLSVAIARNLNYFPLSYDLIVNGPNSLTFFIYLSSSEGLTENSLPTAIPTPGIVEFDYSFESTSNSIQPQYLGWRGTWKQVAYYPIKIEGRFRVIRLPEGDFIVTSEGALWKLSRNGGHAVITATKIGSNINTGIKLVIETCKNDKTIRALGFTSNQCLEIGMSEKKQKYDFGELFDEIGCPFDSIEQCARFASSHRSPEN